MEARSRIGAIVTTLGVMTASLVWLGSVVPASGASAVVTIDAPVAPSAGTVTLTGSVGVEAGEVTTVLYVFDTTRSTASPQGSDCSGNGAVGAEDDRNGDGSVGDILDCEIAGVEALNSSLAATAGLQVGLVAFSNQAAAADLDPAGTATFLPPGFTGGDPLHGSAPWSGASFGTGSACTTPRTSAAAEPGPRSTAPSPWLCPHWATAPAGPKWIMFLSDGQAAIDNGLLQQLTQSGVRLRSFGIGADASCAPSKSLYKMATATGESCQLATQPSSLAAGLTGSRPDEVSSVTVSIEDVSVAATVNAVGGWTAGFTLGAGTYTATVRVILASGAVSTAQRTFTVAPALAAPPPGTVAPGPGALEATAIKVNRPKPSRAVLPSRVTGRIGVPINGLTAEPSLAGSRVLLQARATEGAPWSTVDTDRADRAGKFVLRWTPKARLRLSRVVLPPVKGFAGTAAAVPVAKISACKVTGRGGGWSITCRTTARNGSEVRFLKGGKVTDRARVRRGSSPTRRQGRRERVHHRHHGLEATPHPTRPVGVPPARTSTRRPSGRLGWACFPRRLRGCRVRRTHRAPGSCTLYLKSLTLKGFKSFASATTLQLEPGITCIVGPNGSGKSNVVDALAWVMGEQGAKSLRGGKMEDVIFAGTSGRPPLGRAEVQLTIDNSDGALPIEYAEVTISRTMFRNGGSEYAINGQSCRLLDVQELLSDSGIGREMHVIVGQGQLDTILHATPEDRRGFIEEAAGVLKHRKRKEKALRKLDSTDGNLTRLNDLLTEIRRQLKPLGRQAEVARKAASVQADVRDARARLVADDLVSGPARARAGDGRRVDPGRAPRTGRGRARRRRASRRRRSRPRCAPTSRRWPRPRRRGSPCPG